MERQEFLRAVIDTLNSFVDLKIAGTECVQIIDDLMADEFPDDVPEELYNALHEMHDDLSLFEEDEGIRNAHPTWYYGIEGLQRRAVAYRDRIGELVQ